MKFPSRAALALVLCACGRSADRQDPAEPVDLTATLEAGQARAGFVSNDLALWGGMAAEGERGDVKIYNAVVRFLVQGDRDGDQYIAQGGGVVDADIVRPPDQPARDLVDEWVPMAGIGRLIQPSSITVVDDGARSGVAEVLVEGVESPLSLVEGAVEAWGELLPDTGLKIAHRYRLPADRHLMEVTTTITATDQAVSLTPGDVLIGALEGGQWWGPVRGYDGLDDTPLPWNGYVGYHNEQAVGIFSIDGTDRTPAGAQIIGELLSAAMAFEDPVQLAPGESVSWSRYWGVAADFATLTDEWQDLVGAATDTVSGVVQGAGGPVAGARVVVLVDDAPFTMTLSGPDGSWSAKIPAGASHRVVVDGRGTGVFMDLPDGWAEPGYLAPDHARDLALRSLTEGAPPIPEAVGWGWAEGDDPLPEPGRVRVWVDDGQPFEVRLRALDPGPAPDSRAVRDLPSWIAGWNGDGDVELVVQPGEYEVIAHRGVRHEQWTGTVEVVAGETAEVEVSLPQAFRAEGWMWGDPHNHAGPSNDGEITMVERIREQASAGIQLHFGTDHDHIADYRPLLAPLGVDHVLNSVVATEMSPVVRGHLNLYPLTSRTAEANGGAWKWWDNPVQTTTEETDILRARHGGALTPTSGFVIQANHPDSGLLSFAGWRPGEIRQPDKFSTDFDAIEVINGGGDDTNLDMYLDLSTRGYAVTPTGVSDSHSAFGGSVGICGTWLGLGTDDPRAYTDDALREAMVSRRTIASRGLFLEMSIDPGAVVVGPQTLEVRAVGPSWMAADRITLYRDGEVAEVVEGSSAVFQLDPEADASYVVVGEGDAPMAPLWGSRPIAIASAIRVDVGGDGWTAPLPPYAL